MPILSRIQSIIAIAVFLGGTFLTGLVVHKFDNAQYAKLQASYANATVRAISAIRTYEQGVAKTNDAIAGQSAAVQVNITTHTIHVIQEAPRYVYKTDFVGCIPYGFVRLLDAEILGVAPDVLPLPAGSTNATCAPIDPLALAQSIVANFGIAKQNAEQLNSLGAASLVIATKP